MNDPIKAYAGFDISTKALDLAVVTAEGPTEVLMFARCMLKQATGPVNRVQLAGIAAAEIIASIDQIVDADVIAVAIECPRGYGGPILPIVGAVTGSIDVPVEWYAPATWRSVIRRHYESLGFETLGPPSAYQSKDTSRIAVGKILGHDKAEMHGGITHDSWDAAGVALAYRLEVDAAQAKPIITQEADRMIADITHFLADK